MNTSKQLMRDLAARNPIRDADICDSTGGQRRSLARAWSAAGVDDSTSSGVLARRGISPRRPGRGGLLLVAASVAVLMGGTAAVTSGVTAPLVDWVAADDPESEDRVVMEDLYESDPLAGADLTGISEAQAAEIEDRVATEEENRAAYERYRQCLSAAGFEISKDPMLKPDGTFMNGGLSDAAVQSGVDQECYEREWYMTDMLFQSRPEFQNHPSRTQWMRDCLEERGIEPDETAAELFEQIRQAGISVVECSEAGSN